MVVVVALGLVAVPLGFLVCLLGTTLGFLLDRLARALREGRATDFFVQDPCLALEIFFSPYIGVLGSTAVVVSEGRMDDMLLVTRPRYVIGPTERAVLTTVPVPSLNRARRTRFCASVGVDSVTSAALDLVFLGIASAVLALLAHIVESFRFLLLVSVDCKHNFLRGGRSDT